MNAVISDPDKLESFTAAAEQDEGPVVMLNLLKFKEGGGALAYATYGNLARTIIEEVGGRVLYSGRVDQILVGETGDWDAIALVEYPNRKTFLEMVSRPDYLQAAEHREAGLEQTVLMATTPAARPGQA
ncbi:MAG: DUF1330 domain-containing protein [Chloroflexi bacterium]|nr:DUF1330 domain-containing protein [Chloroflexota bacterium]